DADLPVELDVVEVLGLGLGLQRVGGARVGEPGVVLPVGGVVVEGDLPVQGDDQPVAGEDQRVDLDQRGVLVGEDRPQPLGGRGGAAGGAPAAARGGSPPADTISAAFARSTPVSGSTITWATAAGLVRATSSISMPPCTEQIEV